MCFLIQVCEQLSNAVIHLFTLYYFILQVLIFLIYNFNTSVAIWFMFVFDLFWQSATTGIRSPLSEDVRPAAAAGDSGRLEPQGLQEVPVVSGERRPGQLQAGGPIPPGGHGPGGHRGRDDPRLRRRDGGEHRRGDSEEDGQQQRRREAAEETRRWDVP